MALAGFTAPRRRWRFYRFAGGSRRSRMDTRPALRMHWRPRVIAAGSSLSPCRTSATQKNVKELPPTEVRALRHLYSRTVLFDTGASSRATPLIAPYEFRARWLSADCGALMPPGYVTVVVISTSDRR